MGGFDETAGKPLFLPRSRRKSTLPSILFLGLAIAYNRTVNRAETEAAVYHLLLAAKNQGVFDIGATKLTKLLYLIDCEYFRWARTTLTGAPWLFYHFGPYSADLLAVAGKTPGVAFAEPVEVEGERTFKACRIAQFHADPLARFPPELRAAVEKVCSRWLALDLETILDHVYFHTEPMLTATRSQPLDFSLIPDPRTAEKREPVRSLGSLLTAATRDELARRMRDKKSLQSRRAAVYRLPEDRECTAALGALDAEDEMPANFATEQVHFTPGQAMSGS